VNISHDTYLVSVPNHAVQARGAEVKVSLPSHAAWLCTARDSVRLYATPILVGCRAAPQSVWKWELPLDPAVMHKGRLPKTAATGTNGSLRSYPQSPLGTYQYLLISTIMSQDGL